MTILIFFTYFFIFTLFGIGIFLKQKNTNYRILGGLYLIVAYQSFIVYILESGIIFNYPHFFRTAVPLQFLQGPILYFFVLYTLKSNRFWRMIDLLHLIPFIFVFLDLIPFYILSGEEKINIVKLLPDADYFFFSAGLLTIKQYGVLRCLIVLLYCFFCFKLLYPIFINKDCRLFKKNKLLISWLVFGLFAKFIVFLSILIFVFLLPLRDNFRSIFASSLIGFELLVNIIFLFFNPELISGIKWFSDSKDENFSTIKVVTKNKRDELLLEQLKTLMESKEPFKSKLEVTEVAEQINVSPIKLSSLIKKKYGQSFTDFINSYRLSHIDYQVSQKKHLIYSFESIAYEAGFSSKNAFYSAFKKLRNNTPKKYYNISSTKYDIDNI